MNELREAVVLSKDSLATVRKYLPVNYEAFANSSGQILIWGHDRAGWTLDGYVIPRLASGLITAREIK